MDDAEAIESGRPFQVHDPELEDRFAGSWSGYERDRCFYNTGGGFVQAAYALGLDGDHDGRVLLPLDVDGDGDLDLALLTLQGLRLLINPGPPGRFARVRLRAADGRGPALGAVVRLRSAGAWQQDFVHLTEGFQAQVPSDLHFGLGRASSIDELEVRWPSGLRQRWRDLPEGRLLTLVEGEPEVAVAELPRWPAETVPRAFPAPSPNSSAPTLAGERAPLAEAGRPAVVHFWAPWCAPCERELPELARLAESWSSEVQFAGVSVEREDLASVRAAVDGHGLHYPQFLAEPALLERFFGPGGEAPLPSTFVFDGEGRLRRVFPRAVSGPELAALLESFRDEPPFAQDVAIRAMQALHSSRFEEALGWLEQLIAIEPSDAGAHYDYGMALLGLGDETGAGQAFEMAVLLDPGHAQANYNLGVARLRAGQPAQAMECFQRALGTWGEDHKTLFQLGVAASEAGALEAAFDAFERALAVDPRSAPTWTTKGRLHLALGQADEARRCFEQAVAVDPEAPVARRHLAELGELGE